MIVSHNKLKKICWLFIDRYKFKNNNKITKQSMAIIMISTRFIIIDCCKASIFEQRLRVWLTLSEATDNIHYIHNLIA